MPVVEPPAPHFSIEDLVSSLRISIPSRKNWFVILFLGFWLCGWAFGEIMVGVILIGGLIEFLFGSAPSIPGAVLGGGGLFMLVWLGGWTVGGAFAIYTFLWQITGKEVIEVSHQSIIVQHQVLGLSRPREYLVEYIKDLRVSPIALPSWFGWSHASSFWGRADGSIAFDYGARTFRFGSGVDEAEAKQIAAAIQQRFPQYRKD